MKNKDKIIKYNLLILLGVFVGLALILVYSKLQTINTFVTILELISVIFVMAVPLIYSIIKLYKLNELDRLRKKRRGNVERLFPKNFDYNKASDIDKRNYLIIRLYGIGIDEESLYNFYVQANDFSLSEIERLLSNVIDIDFNTFIHNYILNLKDTNEIVYFVSRLWDYIDRYILNIEHEDKDYQYDVSHLYRYYIEETKKDYLVKVERFNPCKEDWILTQVTRCFTLDESNTLIDNLIKSTNESDKDFVKVEDINLYKLKKSIFFTKYYLKQLDEDLQEYVKYYEAIRKKGHKYYLKLKDNNINLLLKMLPPNLKNNLELCLKNKKYYTTADRKFESYEEEYFDRFDELYNNEKYNILK